MSKHTCGRLKKNSVVTARRATLFKLLFARLQTRRLAAVGPVTLTHACASLTRAAACSETYQYYTLPFCQPATKKFQSEGFGELLAGDRAANSLYKFNFRRNSANETLCTQQLDRKEVEQFRKAVENEYYFQARPEALQALPCRDNHCSTCFARI